MRNSTLRCFRLARSLSAYHDTSPNRPYIHAAPKTMSHSCDCNIIANVCLVRHVSNLSGVSTDYTERWALHCFRAEGALCQFFDEQIGIVAYSVLYLKESMLCAAHLCAVFGQANSQKGNQNPLGSFCRWWSFFCQSGFACYFCVQVWTELSEWRLWVSRGWNPTQITPRNTKTNTETRAHKNTSTKTNTETRAQKYKCKTNTERRANEHANIT